MLVYTHVNSSVDVEKLYTEGVYEVVDNRGSVFDKIKGWEAKWPIEYVKSNFGNGIYKWMDFGSGKGRFLIEARKKGFEVFGVETSAPRAAFAIEKYKLNISTEYYNAGCIFNQKVDILSLFHVLEHLPGSALLRQLVEDNLKSSGTLIIEVPNLESWQSIWSGNSWMHLDLPKHLVHYTPTTLKHLIEKLGFKILKTNYFSVHMGVLGMLDCILKILGFSGNIIDDLKIKKSTKKYLLVILILPFALMLEASSILFKKGGVIRIYAKRNT